MEITVSLNGKLFFILPCEKTQVFHEIRKRFPESDGFRVTMDYVQVTEWNATVYGVE